MLAQSKIRRYGPPERVRNLTNDKKLDVYPKEDQKVRHKRTEAIVSVEIQIFGWCAV